MLITLTWETKAGHTSAKGISCSMKIVQKALKMINTAGDRPLVNIMHVHDQVCIYNAVNSKVNSL